MAPRRKRIVANAVAATLAAVAGWIWYEPYNALDRLADFDASAAQIASRYDRASLRDGFAGQTVPQVETYPPPLTKDMLLDAMVHPEAVRLLVAEPYGAWQFAAAEGVPDDIMQQLGAEDPSPMPRLLEETESWDIDRPGLRSFIARPADRAGGHVYYFRRDGLGWKLVHIGLSEPIR